MRSKTIKKTLFFAILIGINYAFIELISYGFFRVKYGDYDRHTLQLQRIDAINSVSQGGAYTGQNFGDQDVVVKEILHPYIGYTVEGQLRDKDCSGNDCYKRIRVDWDKPFAKRSDDKLIVAILGGSVAVGTINGAPPKYYQRKLKQLPEYQDKEIIIYSMAAGGFRQPQQLMLLNYYYSLGAEFDLVINIDGFNDVAIPVTEYINLKSHPSFPRSWRHRISDTVSPELITLYADKKNLQTRHVHWATFMANPWARNSPLSNLLWTIKHNRYQTALSEQNLQISNYNENTSGNYDYAKVGPDYEFTDWDAFYQYVVDMWANSSVLMKAAAEANGARYFHFLQPNQYIEGSKPTMPANERAIAFVEKGYGSVYKVAFPFIQDKVAWLGEKRVDFHDLTYLYKDIKGPIYIDNCCHVNFRGSAMIVDRIVSTIHSANQKHQLKTQLSHKQP